MKGYKCVFCTLPIRAIPFGFITLMYKIWTSDHLVVNLTKSNVHITTFYIANQLEKGIKVQRFGLREEKFGNLCLQASTCGQCSNESEIFSFYVVLQ